MTQDPLSPVGCGERSEPHRAWSVVRYNRSDPILSMTTSASRDTTGAVSPA